MAQVMACLRSQPQKHKLGHSITNTLTETHTACTVLDRWVTLLGYGMTCINITTLMVARVRFFYTKACY